MACGYVVVEDEYGRPLRRGWRVLPPQGQRVPVRNETGGGWEVDDALAEAAGFPAAAADAAAAAWAPALPPDPRGPKLIRHRRSLAQRFPRDTAADPISRLRDGSARGRVGLSPQRPRRSPR